ncbi:flagellin N-terminal helical domain-containing protein [Calidifontibacillus oryziterrae]|uniref:flagellin N-terminal helical domain-containing protein n=1 Tax=Calidifontibacillus oryziterrae TaxID=1191699 RepID=UPI0002DAC544|nr:flagellin [Calidifontibacillus oryziterrae]
MVNVQVASRDQQLAMIRFSTAQRINSAADDAAGLAISEKMQTQIKGENIASRNMRDSQSLLQTADGALNSTHSVLQRMRELSIQANNGLLTDADRSIIQQEFSQLRDTIDSIGRHTQFNTKPILDGSFQNMKTTTNANGETLSTSISSALASQLGDANSGLSLNDINLKENPQAALNIIDGAIEQISKSRSSIGATTNRLDHSVANSENKHLNMQAAESRIRDADVAKTTIELNRANLFQQTYFATQKMQQMMAGQILNILF